MAAKSSVAGMTMGGIAVTGSKVNATGRRSEGEKARALKQRDTRTPAQKKVDEMYETLTSKQKLAFDLAIDGHSCAFFGGAGVGKSYTLKAIVFAARNVYNKNVMICCPTGISAVNVDGVTIHRQFGFDIGVSLKGKNGKLKPVEHANAALKTCDVLILDEVSMIRIDIFDSIYMSIKKANKDRESKGLKPIQILIMGDPYQLPPIITEDDRPLLEDYYNNPKHSVTGKLGSGFAFNSINWAKLNLKTIQLTEVVRQKDQELVYHLNKIREAKKGFTNYFNHVVCMEEKKDAITLAPYNWMVDKKNKEKLSSIKGREYVFKAELREKATEIDCGRQYELHLKIGAKVMFTINDSPQRGFDLIKDRPEAYKDKSMFVNGTMGILRDVQANEDDYNDNDVLVIEIPSTGEIINLRRNTYDVNVYEEKNGKLEKKKLGYYRQWGIALCFAATIHKSQGLSLQSVNLVPQAFAHGQLYTALSRCTTAEGIHLEDFIREDALILDEEVANFYKNLKEYIPEDNKAKQEDATA